MAERHFYYPNGTEIRNEKEFIDFYSKAYYLFVSEEQENVIDELLETDRNFDDDVVLDFMNWKFGRKRLTDEERAAKSIKYRRTEIDETTLKNIEEIQKTYINENDTDNKETIESIYEKLHRIDGIGVIYALALLFLISKGKYPIFDWRVRCAKWAIEGNKKPWQKAQRKSLSENTVPSKYWEYRDFFESMEKLRHKSREVDRALWTYGLMYGGESCRCKEKLINYMRQA